MNTIKRRAYAHVGHSGARAQLAAWLHRAAAQVRLALVRRPARDVIYGDPRCEAWTADGEPFDMVMRQQYLNAQRARRCFRPHGRAH